MDQDQENKDNNNVVDKSVSIEQIPELPTTPVTEESSNTKMPTAKKINKKILFFVIAGMILFLTLISILVLLQILQIPVKKEQALIPTPSASLSQEDLQITEGGIAEGGEEIAYLQNGKIWLINNNLTKKMKHESAVSATTITSFEFSPDGKELYWITEAGELWKKDKSGKSNPLVTQASDMTSAIFKDPITKTVSTYQKGKVAAFHLSPNGEYVAYETLETFTGCCMSPYDIPVYKIKIMKNDGTSKAVVETPIGVTRPMLFFDGWFSNSQKVLIHFSAPDEATQGSPLYEVGINGKYPKKFTGIDFPEFDDTTTVAGALPAFSPDGEKMIYVEAGVVGEGRIWLADIDGANKKLLLDNEKLHLADLSWSEDGKLLIVNGTDTFYIFNQETETVYQTEVEKTEMYENIISSDNKYIVGLSNSRGYQADEIFIINIDTKERKGVSLVGPNRKSGNIYVYPQFISGNGRLYYLLSSGDVENQKSEDVQSLLQLWAVDIQSWKNYKIADNVTKVVQYPQNN